MTKLKKIINNYWFWRTTALVGCLLTIFMTFKNHTYSKEVNYWKERCLFMESQYAPDLNDTFKLEDKLNILNSCLSSFAITPLQKAIFIAIPIFMRIGKQKFDKVNLGILREQKKWYIKKGWRYINKKDSDFLLPNLPLSKKMIKHREMKLNET